MHKTFNLYCTQYIFDKYNPKSYLFTKYVVVRIYNKMEIFYRPTYHKYRQFENPLQFKTFLSAQ